MRSISTPRGATRRSSRPARRTPRWLRKIPAPLRHRVAGMWTLLAPALTYRPTPVLLLLTLPLLFLAYQAPATHRSDVGGGADGYYLRGFFARERGNGADFRWSGGRGQIVVPAAAGNSVWTATLRLASPRGELPPPPVDVLVDGRLVARFTPTAAFQDYTFQFRRDPFPANDLAIALETPTFGRPGTDDRLLGVALDEYTLRAERAGPAAPFFPPPAYAALALALLVLTAGALGALGLDRRLVAAVTAVGLAATLADAVFQPALRLLAPTLVAALALAPPALRRLATRATIPSRLVAILLAGLAIRVALFPPWIANFGGFRPDPTITGEWAVRLVREPLAGFYAAPITVDHLPGDMWILWLAARLYQVFSPDMAVGALPFLFLLKLVAALADAGLGLLLYLLGRRLGGPGAGLLAAGFFLFNPASIFLTSIWGQWDPVSTCLVLLALLLLLRGSPEWSLPVLTHAALIKPQLGLLAPLFAVAFLLRYLLPHGQFGARHGAPVEPLARSLRRALVAVVASLAILLLVPLPFDVGPPPLPTRWTLPERIAYALNQHWSTSRGAFNFWTTPLGGLFNERPLKHGDDQRWLLGLTYQVWGALLFGVAYLTALARYWRRRTDAALVWAFAAVTFAMFMLLTRVRERYLFPALVFLALAAALAPRVRPLFALLSLTYLANLAYVYSYDWFAAPPLVYALSLVNLALFVGVFAWGLLAPPDTERDLSRSASGDRQPATVETIGVHGEHRR